MVKHFSLGLCRYSSWFSASDALDASSERPGRLFRLKLSSLLLQLLDLPRSEWTAA